MPKINLSVIVPAFNEEKRLPKTLEEIEEYLKEQDYDYEIIVVSDGSTDRTDEVVRGLIPKIKGLRLLAYKKNQGKGFSVKEGMLKAKGKYRIFTDADNSTSIEQIEKMWPYFQEDFDIVIGSRDVKGAVLDPPQSSMRRFVGETFKYLRKIIVGLWDIEDSQCGFKCFTQRAAEDVFPKCEINRFAFDAEMLVIARKLGYKTKEVPVYWKNDPNSKVKFKSMTKMGLDLLKIRKNLIVKKYD